MKKSTPHKTLLAYMGFVLLTLTIPAMAYVANLQPQFWPTWLPEWLFSVMTDKSRLIVIAIICAFLGVFSRTSSLAGTLTGAGAGAFLGAAAIIIAFTGTFSFTGIFATTGIFVFIFAIASILFYKISFNVLKNFQRERRTKA